MVEANLCVKVHPYVNQGLYLSVVLRPVPSTREYLIVKENGDIEGATKYLRRKLAISYLSTESVNLKLLSPELAKINHTFNLITSQPGTNKDHKTDKKIDLAEASSEYIKALKLHKAYTTEGKRITLPCYTYETTNNEEEEILHLHCRIEPVTFGSITMRLFLLTPTKAKHNEIARLPKKFIPKRISLLPG